MLQFTIKRDGNGCCKLNRPQKRSNLNLSPKKCPLLVQSFHAHMKMPNLVEAETIVRLSNYYFSLNFLKIFLCI